MPSWCRILTVATPQDPNQEGTSRRFAPPRRRRTQEEAAASPRPHAESGRPGPWSPAFLACPPVEAIIVRGGDLGGNGSKNLGTQVPAPMSPGDRQGGPPLLPDRFGKVAGGL